MRTIEDTYLNYFWLWQQWQWENYAFAVKHDLNALDAEIYRLFRRLPEFKPQDRHETVLRQIILRAKVDKHPQAARLRNRLDDWDYYLDRLPVKKLSDPHALQLQLAEAVRPDVLQLMRLRNHLAQDQGFENYPELVFFCEELDPVSTRTTLDTFLDINLPAVKEFVQENGFTWQNWFSRLDSIAAHTPLQSRALLEEVLEKFSAGALAKAIHVHADADNLSGYAAILENAKTVRILTHPVQSLRQRLTLFHEIGHAVAHLQNRQHGLFRTWTAAVDESLAVFFEYLSATFCLDDPDRDLAYRLLRTEYARCALSALFEFALWQDPDQAEDQFSAVYARMGLPVEDPQRWALDSFRSIDALYIHNYVIGAWLAEQTLQDHSKTAHEWFHWLTQNIYQYGRAQPMPFVIHKLDSLHDSSGF